MDGLGVAARLHLQDGKAVVVVVERYPLDGTDERLFWRLASNDAFNGRTGTGPSHRHFDGSLQNDFRRIQAAEEFSWRDKAMERAVSDIELGVN